MTVLTPVTGGSGAATGVGLVGGHFRLGAQLATSAHGATHRATDERTQESLALRILRVEPSSVEGVFSALGRAAHAARAARHDGIVPPVVVSRDGDAIVYATPYLEGGSVDELLGAPEPLPFDAVLALLSDAAAALDHAHDFGLVHGGVAPTNIFADGDGRARITDFGVRTALRIAAPAERDATAGRTGYAAPEQWRGQHPDARTDQYALAVIAYELIVGQRRHSPEVEGIATLEPLEVSSLAPLRPGLGMHVNAALQRALSASAVNRFPSVTAFVRALASAGAGSRRQGEARNAVLFHPRQLAVMALVAAGAAVVTLALDANVRRSLEARWRAMGRRASTAASTVERGSRGVSRTVAATGSGVRGQLRNAAVTTPDAPPPSSTQRPAPAAAPARALLPGAGRRTDATGSGGTRSTSPGGGGTEMTGRGTNSEPVGGSGGDAGGGGGTLAGRAATPGGTVGNILGRTNAAARRAVEFVAPSRGTSGLRVPASGGPAAALSSVGSTTGSATGSATGSDVSSAGAPNASTAAAPGVGVVSVSAANASPVVLVDGVPRGIAPTLVRVGPGAHGVEVRSPGMRFRPARITVRVGAGDTSVVAFWRVP